MFEKEAEEYVNTHVAPPFSISEQDLYDCFQMAATFGYNKAKEELKEIVKHLLPSCRNYPDNNLEWIKKAEQFLRDIDIDNAIQQSNQGLDFDHIADEMKQDLEESCPDCFCEDCAKDCGIKELGLAEVKK